MLPGRFVENGKQAAALLQHKATTIKTGPRLFTPQRCYIGLIDPPVSLPLSLSFSLSLLYWHLQVDLVCLFCSVCRLLLNCLLIPLNILPFGLEIRVLKWKSPCVSSSVTLSVSTRVSLIVWPFASIPIYASIRGSSYTICHF